MIVASLAVAAFATAVIGYAVIEVDQAEAGKVMSADQASGVETFDDAKTQEHVATTVEYQETPPVGGAHDTVRTDRMGTVHTVGIRRENAVHSLEHGATCITCDPDRLHQAGIDPLSALVEDTPGTMLSPRSGQDAPIPRAGLERLPGGRVGQRPAGGAVRGVPDVRSGQQPEPGASCDSPAFAASPQADGDRGAPHADGHARRAADMDGAAESATGSGHVARGAGRHRLGLRHRRRPVRTVDRRARVREGSPPWGVHTILLTCRMGGEMA